MAYKLRLCSHYFFITSLLHKTFRNDVNIMKLLKRPQSSNAEIVTVSLSDGYAEDVIDDGSTSKNRRFNISNCMSPLTAWNEFKSKSINNTNYTDVQILNMHIDDINNYIMKHLFDKTGVDIDAFVMKCIKHDIRLSQKVIIQLLQMYCLTANINMVGKLETMYTKNVCKKINYNYYLGLAHWSKGNITEAFANFCIVFQGNYESKAKMRKLLNMLIMDAVRNSSEASVVLIEKHSLEILETLSERSPILAYWKACMFSKWFKDNQKAVYLYNENKKLRFYLDDSLYIYTSQALKMHKEDTIIDILQLLLKYNKMHQYALIVGYLFDYRFYKGDYGGCLEIIKSCLTLKIKLNKHDEKYTKILELYFNATDLEEFFHKVDTVRNFNIKF